MKYPFFCGYNGKDIKCFRIFGYGIYITKSYLNFSERNGYKKIIKISPKWRIRFLNREIFQ